MADSSLEQRASEVGFTKVKDSSRMVSKVEQQSSEGIFSSNV